MSFVPSPPRGLGGSSNYIITAGGAPLVDLGVNIAVSEAIFSTIGFAFQLNCWSLAEPAPPDPPTPSPANTPSGWQQFYLFMPTTDHSLNPIPVHISAGIEPWPASEAGIPASDKTGLVNWHHQLTPTFDGGIVPAGTLLSIFLQSNDDLQIQFVMMSVTMPEDAGGQSFSLGPVDMTTLPLIAGPGDETSANLAPIVAFQMNLVGPISARKSHLYMGAGTFTYFSVTPLLVTRTAPADVASTTVTQENANSGYLPLPAGPSNSIEQYFFTASQDVYAPGAYLATSRQFGTDQTDVFIVNQTGQIDIYCSADLGPWQLCSPPLG